MLNQKIYSVLSKSISRYSDFGTFGSGAHETKIWGNDVIIVVDVKENNDGSLMINGEFTYFHNSRRDKRTVKYEATIKQISDDLSVIKVICQNPKDKKWHKIFPINNF